MGKTRKIIKNAELVPLLCGTALAVLLIALLCPSQRAGAEALENTTVGASTRAALRAAATLSVALDPEVVMNVTPTSDGTFTMSPAHLSVSTNNPEGYSIYLNTEDSTNALVYTDHNKTGAEYEIPALSHAAIPGNFANNTWGYALTREAATDATEYQAVPLTSTKIASIDRFVAQDSHQLTFGAKIDGNRPAGEYQNHVTISVVANPNEVTNLLQLVYMQDMSPEICTQTGKITRGNEVSKRLIDIRDGKQYWVAKLADQNCWMTQNLAFDLKQGETLTPDTSDVSRNWTVPIGTEYSVPNAVGTIPSDSPENWSSKSWNLGNYVLTTPAQGQLCAGDGADQGNSVLSGQTLARCSDFQDVSSLNWRPTLVAGTNHGDWNGTSGYLAAQKNDTGGEYDAHYLIGNYYQFNAATAGTGGRDLTSQDLDGTPSDSKLSDAPDSICPANWQLPRAGRVTSPTSGQPYMRAGANFYNLIYHYGYPETGRYGNDKDNGGDGFAPIITNQSPEQNVAQLPMAFTRSGYISEVPGALSDAGRANFTWSATADDNSLFSFYLRINPFNVYPSSNTFRRYGYAVRCTAKQ